MWKSNNQPHKHRILIVEDHADTAEALSQWLAMAGYTARAVHDGPTALIVARTFRPHVVLTDIGLPVMNGHELARQMRLQPETSESLLVAFTCHKQGAELSPAGSFRAEFDEYLEKPVDPARIETVIRRLLGSLPVAKTQPAG